MTVRVLFVCLGNICRSPTAHAVFERLVDAEGLSQHIEVDSAGTGAWHVGQPPDERAMAAAKVRGYRMAHLRARQVDPADLEAFDYVLAMDRSNLEHLRALCPRGLHERIALFLSHADCQEDEVPDPYYGGQDGFGLVLDLVESAAAGLLRDIRASGKLDR